MGFCENIADSNGFFNLKNSILSVARMCSLWNKSNLSYVIHDVYMSCDWHAFDSLRKNYYTIRFLCFFSLSLFLLVYCKTFAFYMYVHKIQT